MRKSLVVVQLSREREAVGAERGIVEAQGSEKDRFLLDGQGKIVERFLCRCGFQISGSSFQATVGIFHRFGRGGQRLVGGGGVLSFGRGDVDQELGERVGASIGAALGDR